MRRTARRILIPVTLTALAVSMALVTWRPPVAKASSHREAPLIVSDPRADNTDVYAFVSPDRPGTVTLIANWIPFEEPSGGPDFYNFDPNVLYQIKIDNTGDGVADISIRVRFTSKILNPDTILYNTGPITSLSDPDFNYRQFAKITVQARVGSRIVTADLASNLPLPPVNIGPRSTPNYDDLASAAIATIPTPVGDIKFFAGQRDEGFYIDTGSAFDLLGLRPFNGAHLIPLPTAPGVDFTAGYNVHSIAFQIPSNLLARNGVAPTDPTDPNAVIGVWATSSRRRVTVLRPDKKSDDDDVEDNDDNDGLTRGKFVQVSRLANPLVNELLVPRGTTQPGVIPGTKDKFNASSPKNDSQFAAFILDPEPSRLIHLLYPTINVPPPPRSDVVAIFATGIPAGAVPGFATFLSDGKPHEMMRLNMAIPPAGTPNRLGLLAGDLAGFPNGRRVGDDVVDIELRVLAGGTPFTPAFNISPNNILGDGVNQNDRPFLNAFPYLASPVSGYENPLHGLTGTTDTTETNTGSPTSTPTPRP